VGWDGAEAFKKQIEGTANGGTVLIR
jgi:hypothetical protein